LDTYFPDIQYLHKQGRQGTCLFFEAERGPQKQTSSENNGVAGSIFILIFDRKF